MDARTPARNNTLDWLRVLGILFVFVYHTTRIYNVEDWNVKNAIWYPSVELWNGFATTFMMPLMFVVSGASLFYATRKGGSLTFVKDKVLRLLVPLLAADLIHISIQDYLWAVSHGKFSGSFFRFLPQYYRPGGFNLISSHLWYLWFLFLFSLLLYPLLRWLRRGETLSRLNGWLSKGGTIYILALPILLLALLPSEFPLMGSSGGYPYLIYLFFVLYGFLIVSDQRLQERIHALRWVSLPVGLALAVGFTLVISRLSNPEEFSAGLILAGTMRYFGGWICVLAFFGLGMQFLNRRSARLDYANQAVLPFYILHQTVIQAVGFFVLQRLIPEGLEWALIAVVSLAVILLVYEFLVRRWNVMRFLFGMKRLPAQPLPGPVEPQLGAPGAE